MDGTDKGNNNSSNNKYRQNSYNSNKSSDESIYASPEMSSEYDKNS